MVGVEQEDERVILHRLAVRTRGIDPVAVDVYAQHMFAILPVPAGHLAPIRSEPPHVRQARFVHLLAAEEALPAKHRMLPAQTDQPAREIAHLLRPRRLEPIEPRDLVVLAPGVVVAALGTVDLIPAQQHRRAL